MHYTIRIYTIDNVEYIFNVKAKHLKVTVHGEGPEIISDGHLLNTQVESRKIQKVTVNGQIRFFTKLNQQTVEVV